MMDIHCSGLPLKASTSEIVGKRKGNYHDRRDNFIRGKENNSDQQLGGKQKQRNGNGNLHLNNHPKKETNWQHQHRELALKGKWVIKQRIESKERIQKENTETTHSIYK
ncbi:hypothetical protein CHS0354_017244 [Potamilus streckersoni]|uniref:Uncharacterized protein n=1 Tax=Potamilus streckersoni TaxID=2493646 RepID=A0AAE0VKZ0_9BIVA|nr:hypothetical protein CHS0354_017244 [Potamilus streckersoni]